MRVQKFRAVQVPHETRLGPRARVWAQLKHLLLYGTCSHPKSLEPAVLMITLISLPRSLWGTFTSYCSETQSVHLHGVSRGYEVGKSDSRPEESEWCLIFCSYHMGLWSYKTYSPAPELVLLLMGERRVRCSYGGRNTRK